jgi:hypothetical protein
MKIVACITFGHEADEVRRSLAPALELAAREDDVEVVVIDDSSGRGPQLSQATCLSTPRRMGFPAVVQFLIESVYPEATRLVLVNPDATVGDSLPPLLESQALLAIPTIDHDGRIENVRLATTPWREVRNLLLGEAKVRYPITSTGRRQDVSCPPFAPSGAVISIDANALRSAPLRSEFFWLEFSDWVLRRARMGAPTTLEVLPNRADHLGASTAVKYPLSVAASQARAKVAFVREYGSASSRAVLPIAVLSRGVRFALKRRSTKAGVFLLRAAYNMVDWRVPA